MAATDVLRAVTVLCFLLIRTADQLWLLYFLTVVQFVLSSLYTLRSAFGFLLPSIVASRDLVTTNAGQLHLEHDVGARIAFRRVWLLRRWPRRSLRDRRPTFLLSAWFVLRMVPCPAVADYVRRLKPSLISSTGCAICARGVSSPGVEPVKAAGTCGAQSTYWRSRWRSRSFPFRGSGSVTLGIIYAATGIGTGLGPLIAYFLGDGRQAALRAITVSFAVLTAGVLLLGTAPTLPWIVTATLMRSVGTGTLWVFSSTILQSTVENRYRGRVFAFEFAALTLLQSVSTMWAGVAVDRLQLAVQSVFVLTSVVSLAVTLAWLAFQLRVSRRPVPAV